MSKGKTWSRQVEVQGGKENEEGGALVYLSVTTQTKSYFKLNIGTPDSLKKNPKTPNNITYVAEIF